MYTCEYFQLVLCWARGLFSFRVSFIGGFTVCGTLQRDFVHFKPPNCEPPNPFVAGPLLTCVFLMLLGGKVRAPLKQVISSLGFEICTGFRIQHNTPNECFILLYGLSRKPLSP